MMNKEASQMIEYRTVVEGGGRHEIEVKGSRFICHAQRIFNEEEAKMTCFQAKHIQTDLP